MKWIVKLLCTTAVSSLKEIEVEEFGRAEKEAIGGSKPPALSVSKFSQIRKYRWPGFHSDLYFQSHWYGSIGNTFKWCAILWLIQRLGFTGSGADMANQFLYFCIATELCGIIYWPFFLESTFASANKSRQWASDAVLLFLPGFRRWLFAPSVTALIIAVAFYAFTK